MVVGSSSSSSTVAAASSAAQSHTATMGLNSCEVNVRLVNAVIHSLHRSARPSIQYRKRSSLASPGHPRHVSSRRSRAGCGRDGGCVHSVGSQRSGLLKQKRQVAVGDILAQYCSAHRMPHEQVPYRQGAAILGAGESPERCLCESLLKTRSYRMSRYNGL